MVCDYFGKCGSCTLYDVGYDVQLNGKINRVSTLLSPYYKGEIEIYKSPDEHYRARAEFRIWHTKNRCDYAMGNITKDGIVRIDRCPKVSKHVERRMLPLLEMINNSDVLRRKLFGVEFLSTTTDKMLITLLYHKRLDNEWETAAKQLEKKIDAHIIGRSRKQKVILSQDFVTERLTVGDEVYEYRYHEGAFTQPNPKVNEMMLTWAKKQAAKAGGGDLLESYCGLGNFTMPLSRNFEKVLATEVSKISIKAAKENCKINEVQNVTFVRMSSEEMVQAVEGERPFRRMEGVDLGSYDFSTALVDPPRAGLDGATIKLISHIPHIIYISCNPETLIRDLEVLSKTHRVESAAIFDQFPYTNHIESGVFLTARG